MVIYREQICHFDAITLKLNSELLSAFILLEVSSCHILTLEKWQTYIVIFSNKFIISEDLSVDYTMKSRERRFFKLKFL